MLQPLVRQRSYASLSWQRGDHSPTATPLLQLRQLLLLGGNRERGSIRRTWTKKKDKGKKKIAPKFPIECWWNRVCLANSALLTGVQPGLKGSLSNFLVISFLQEADKFTLVIYFFS